MLSKLQIKRLILLAQRAFTRSGALARGRGEIWAADASAFTAWRHREVAAACGKAGLRACGQRDYKAVEAHFFQLLGEDGAAMESNLRAQSEPIRQVQHKILGQLRELGRPITYAAAICKRMTRGQRDLETANVRDLWNVSNALYYEGKKEQHAH